MHAIAINYSFWRKSLSMGAGFCPSDTIVSDCCARCCFWIWDAITQSIRLRVALLQIDNHQRFFLTLHPLETRSLQKLFGQMRGDKRSRPAAAFEVAFRQKLFVGVDDGHSRHAELF